MIKNKEEERKDLRNFINLFDEKLDLGEINFEDSPDLKFRYGHLSIGLEHTRTKMLPSINGDDLKIFQNKKTRILEELEKYLIQNQIIFGELSFTFNLNLIKTRLKDREVAQELFDILRKNLNVKKNLSTNEIIDLVTFTDNRPVYLDNILFHKRDFEQNWLMDLSLTFDVFDEKAAILDSIKGKDLKIKDYLTPELDCLWLLIVVPDDISGSPINKNRDLEISVPKNIARQWWERIFIYYRFSNSYKEIKLIKSQTS